MWDLCWFSGPCSPSVPHFFWLLKSFLPFFWGDSRFKGRDLMEPSHLDSLSTKYLALCICTLSYLLVGKASLMMSRQGTDLWAKQNITRNHFSVLFRFSSCVWFYPRLLSGLSSSSCWTSRQCRTWAPSCGQAMFSLTWTYHAQQIVGGGFCGRDGVQNSLFIACRVCSCIKKALSPHQLHCFMFNEL